MDVNRGRSAALNTWASQAMSIHPAMAAVDGRFPQLRERVVCLFERDENFRDVCEEYEACKETVARLEASDPAPEALRNEYAALLLGLERELLRYLEEASA